MLMYVAGSVFVVLLLALVLVRRFGVGSSALRELLTWMERKDLECRVVHRPAEVGVGVHLEGETPDAMIAIRVKKKEPPLDPENVTADDERNVYVELYSYTAGKSGKKHHCLEIWVWTSAKDRVKYTLVCMGDGSKLISADLYERGVPRVEAEAALKIHKDVLRVVASASRNLRRS
jgi:hypothetical protein